MARFVFLARTLAGWALGALLTPASAFALVTALGMGAAAAGALWVIGGFWATAFAALAPAALAHARGGSRGVVLGLAAAAGPGASALGAALLGPAAAGAPAQPWFAAVPALAIVGTLALTAVQVRGPQARWRAVTLQALAIQAAAAALLAGLAIALGGADPARTLAAGAGAFVIGLAMVGLACGVPAALTLRWIAGRAP